MKKYRPNHNIYLDNSATTKPFPKAMQAVTETLNVNYGNPSSAHRIGQKAEKLVEETRRLTAYMLKVNPEEIIFTSGGTEANNLAITGTAFGYENRGKHIILSEIEHPSVINTAYSLEEKGFEISFIPVDDNGIISIDKLKSEVNKDTILVSIMHVNNEIGTIQPLHKISQIIRDYNKPDKPLFFHVDAVQSFCKLPINQKKWGVDLLSVSSHKIHGPMGCGALFVSNKINLNPLLSGGNQENGIRSGTENVPGIAGFKAAVEKNLSLMPQGINNIRELKNLLKKKILEKIEEASVNGPTSNGENDAPHIINISFPGIKAEVLLHILEEKGIYVSVGSACHKSSEPSHVLKALGLSTSKASEALRFSLSHFTTEEDILFAADIVQKEYYKLRRIFS